MASDDSNDPKLPVPIGAVLLGKYRMESVLGSSGMGVVYSARHIEMENTVAVKFLLAKGGPDSEEALVRFRREAKFMARMNSDHVVRVFDVGKTEEGAPFIVMEELVGEDLSRISKRDGPMPVELAVDYVLQACAGIIDAHAVGVVHRDLKPSNLFLASLGNGRQVVKVIDFGIAKFRGSEVESQDDGITHTQVIIGTPKYMAPEQVRSAKDVDGRADVWSLGMILAELLCGVPLFKAPSVSELIVKILTVPVPRVDSLRPDLPSSLADVIAAALIKDEASRTPSVAAFAKALLPFAPAARRLAMEPTLANVAAPPSARTFDASDPHLPAALSSGSFPQPNDATAISVTAMGFGSPNSARRRKVSRVAILSGVGVALLLAGIVGKLSMDRDRGSAAAVAPPASLPSASPAASAELPVPVTAPTGMPTAAASGPSVANQAVQVAPTASAKKLGAAVVPVAAGAKAAVTATAAAATAAPEPARTADPAPKPTSEKDLFREMK